MRMDDYLKLTGSDVDDPVATQQRRDWLEAHEDALRQQAETKEATHALAERLRRTIREHGFTNEEAAINYMATEDRLRAAVRLEREVWEERKAALLEAEANVIGASPWLAGATTAAAAARIETKSAPWAVKMDEGTARITGLASPFGGNPDAVGDIVEPGAYTATIAAAQANAQAKGGRYLWPLLWQHDPHQPIGGILAAREERDGLHIEAQIATDTELGKYAYSLLQKRMIQGLSIGFITRKDRYVGQVRHLLAIDLLEISAVTFPAAPTAHVTGTGR